MLEFYDPKSYQVSQPSCETVCHRPLVKTPAIQSSRRALRCILLYTSELLRKKPDWIGPNRALGKQVATTLTAPFPEPRAGP